ncbi:MAG TPA: chemotaxis protein CheW [Verrucomicrobiae bacterium]|nr:chemotaxis protein CheW [Verrucomicrobiae bacterium]
MLFLLFKLGNDRYALEAGRVIEVLPLLELKKIPSAPRGVAGIFNYRGRPVPAVDISELTLGHPAPERLSTRIIVISHPDHSGKNQPLGLIAEHATEIIRRDRKEFVEPGLPAGSPPFLGPILMDDQGAIQWVREQRLLPESVRNLLFSETVEAVRYDERSTQSPIRIDGG